MKGKNKSLETENTEWEEQRPAAVTSEVTSSLPPLTPPTDYKSSETGSGRKKGRGKPPPPSLPLSTLVGGRRTAGRSRGGRKASGDSLLFD